MGTERRKHERVAAETPIHEVICGNEAGQVPLPKLARYVQKLGRQVKPAEMTDVLYRLKALDVEADGEIGDRDPVMAVKDALRGREVDEIIVSTLPRGLSRWLGEDVPSRLADAVAVPITVVTQPGD